MTQPVDKQEMSLLRAVVEPLNQLAKYRAENGITSTYQLATAAGDVLIVFEIDSRTMFAGEQ